MAHDLATTNGRVAMMYNEADGGAPWHRLGTPTAGATSGREAIGLAGLDYEVEGRPLYYLDGLAPVQVPGYAANVRTDDGRMLGVVSGNYKVVQNRECFAFLDAVAAESGITYESAGAFGDGERCWLLGRIPGDIGIRGTDDAVRRYVLLYNSHDATSSLRIHWTPTRVVCWNTCSAALAEGAGQGVTIRHTGEVDRKVQEAQKTLGLAVRYYDALGLMIDALADCRPTEAQVNAYFATLYPDPDGKTADRPDSRARTARMTLWGLYERGMGQDMPGVAGTAWAAYNAVTEFVDHHDGRAGRSVDRDDPRQVAAAQNRMASAWFGEGARVKAKAFSEACHLAGTVAWGSAAN